MSNDFYHPVLPPSADVPKTLRQRIERETKIRMTKKEKIEKEKKKEEDEEGR